MSDLTVVCHYATEGRVNSNLLASLDSYTGPQVLMHGVPSLSAAYASADLHLTTPLGLYVHDDVYLPPDFFDLLDKAVRSVETMDPNWGLIGAIGTYWEVTGETESHIKREQRYHGHVWDSTAYRSFGCLYTARQVETLDGCLVLKRKDVGGWDPRIPGYHACVEDLCLQMQAAGRTVWAVAIPIVHNSKIPNIDVETDPGYLAAKAYVMAKWPQKRPIVTPSQIWR